MILVAVGTQKHKFSRLLNGVISLDEQLVIQRGYNALNTNHKNFKFSKNLESYFKKCDLVIAHAGVGITMTAFEYNKPLIVVARLQKYNEHIDDHQLELCYFLEKNNLALVCSDVSELPNLIKKAKTHKFNKYISNNENFNDKLVNLIKEL